MTIPTVEIEKFIECIKLPQGFKFKEWMPGCVIAPPRLDNVGVYFDSLVMAVEKIVDGSIESFELPHLRKNESGKITVPVLEIAQAVERAVMRLQGTPIPNVRFKAIEFTSRMSKEEYEREMIGFQGYSYDDAKALAAECDPKIGPYWIAVKSVA